MVTLTRGEALAILDILRLSEWIDLKRGCLFCGAHESYHSVRCHGVWVYELLAREAGESPSKIPPSTESNDTLGVLFRLADTLEHLTRASDDQYKIAIYIDGSRGSGQAYNLTGRVIPVESFDEESLRKALDTMSAYVDGELQKHIKRLDERRMKLVQEAQDLEATIDVLKERRIGARVRNAWERLEDGSDASEGDPPSSLPEPQVTGSVS